MSGSRPNEHPCRVGRLGGRQRPFTSRLILTLAVAMAACQPAERDVSLHVVANDFAFTAPDSAPAGRTTFTLENRGTRVHEMFIGLLRPNVTAAQIVAAHQKGLGFRQLRGVYLDDDLDVALFAWPGQSSAASAALDLEQGRSYILLCQLRDSIGMPQHAALGMFKVLYVRR